MKVFVYLLLSSLHSIIAVILSDIYCKVNKNNLKVVKIKIFKEFVTLYNMKSLTEGGGEASLGSTR